MSPVKDHPLRYDLANELHARPFPSMGANGRVAFLALKREANAASRDKTEDRNALLALLDRMGSPHPAAGATHYFGPLGRYTLKWEQHTEFVTYTIFCDQISERAFDQSEFDVFPSDWLSSLSDNRITSALIRVEKAPTESQISENLANWFVPESLAVSRVLDDGAIVASDFTVDETGHQKFAIFVAPETGERRLGRIVQRLCEIETYKAMSMLGFFRCKQMGIELAEIDAQLFQVMEAMSNTSQKPEDTLHLLLKLSTELEHLLAVSAFRFGATKAYKAIVDERIMVLREQRFQGRQTFYEFMMRRYEPAMRTVMSTETRLQAMADRAMRAGDLLRTQVDVERSAQNQALLESMDKRSDMQLRLQETVEGLSVVAISYYAVSLVSYLFYPLAETLSVSKGMITAVLTLPVVVAVWMMVRQIRKKMGHPPASNDGS